MVTQLNAIRFLRPNKISDKNVTISATLLSSLRLEDYITIIDTENSDYKRYKLQRRISANRTTSRTFSVEKL